MKKIMTMKNKFLAGLLAALGFSSCSPFADHEGGDDNGGGMVMYGVIRTSFVVKGKVTDTAGKPIEGIRVVLRPALEEYYTHTPNDTLYTSSAGTFVTNDWPEDLPGGYVVEAKDVDGAENGSYKSAERMINFGPERSDYGWEEGRMVKTVDFQLKEDKEGEGK